MYEVTLSRKFFISYLFKDVRSGFKWLFTSVYNKGEGRDHRSLLEDLEECREKWTGP